MASLKRKLIQTSIRIYIIWNYHNRLTYYTWCHYKKRGLQPCFKKRCYRPQKHSYRIQLYFLQPCLQTKPKLHSNSPLQVYSCGYKTRLQVFFFFKFLGFFFSFSPENSKFKLKKIQNQLQTQKIQDQIQHTHNTNIPKKFKKHGLFTSFKIFKIKTQIQIKTQTQILLEYPVHSKFSTSPPFSC